MSEALFFSGLAILLAVQEDQYNHQIPVLEVVPFGQSTSPLSTFPVCSFHNAELNNPKLQV